MCKGERLIVVQEKNIFHTHDATEAKAEIMKQEKNRGLHLFVDVPKMGGGRPTQPGQGFPGWLLAWPRLSRRTPLTSVPTPGQSTLPTSVFLPENITYFVLKATCHLPPLPCKNLTPPNSDELSPINENNFI